MLIEPLEFLAKEGIRINFGKGVSSILVGFGEINEENVYIGPEEDGAIGVCYVPEKAKESNFINVNSSGQGLTQIAFYDRLYTICHTRNDISVYLNNSFIKISREKYNQRIGVKLEFWF